MIMKLFVLPASVTKRLTWKLRYKIDRLVKTGWNKSLYVVANELYCDIAVREFELRFCFYFRIISFGKSIYLLILAAIV